MTAARVIASVAASSSLVDRAEWPSRDLARLPTGQGRRPDDDPAITRTLDRRRRRAANERAKIAIVWKWIQSRH